MSTNQARLSRNEFVYCWTVGISTAALVLVIAAIAMTKNGSWARPAYGLTFTLLALFPLGIMMEVSNRRWPVPLIVVLFIVMSGSIGVLLTLPLVLPIP